MKSRRGIAKRTAAVFLIIAALIILAVIAGLVLLRQYRAGDPYISEAAEKVKLLLCERSFPKEKDAFAELSAYTPEEYSGAEAVRTETALLLKNSARGYSVSLPPDTELDFSFAPSFVRAECEKFSAVISREYSTEKSAEKYAEHYFDRFILSDEWRAANGAELLGDISRDNARLMTLHLADVRDGRYDTYTYVNLFTGTKLFYRMTFKYFYADRAAVQNEIKDIADSFSYFRSSGECEYGVSFSPDFSDRSDEARETISRLLSSDRVQFGIYTDGVSEYGINTEIPALEERLEYRFSPILIYRHLSDEFPTEFMEKCAEQGRLTELTYQITVSNNLDLFGYSPQLDIYRGGVTERLREFAKAAAEFGKPFLFRLSNEMNSDWTSWSGAVNMCDPEIYTFVWRRIHNIFEEEGATNAIWVWNPNDRSYPPAGWNAQEAYWPGEEYVDIIGITGYNTGDRNAATGEHWRSFENIYKAIEKKTAPLFGDYPWMITEFASASEGGDKEKWVSDMFRVLPDFPNIRLAVWFDSTDMDGDEISRDYRIDSPENTLEAFREGLG